MRRGIAIAAGLYVCAALGTRAAEKAGIAPLRMLTSCWCRRTILSAFRWVMPIGHR